LFIASNSISDNGSIASVGSAIDTNIVYHPSFLFSAQIQSSKSKLFISSIVMPSTSFLIGAESFIHFFIIKSA
jgi:hypothetical protein